VRSGSIVIKALDGLTGGTSAGLLAWFMSLTLEQDRQCGIGAWLGLKNMIIGRETG
jgi:hypothetical protein